MAGNFSLDDYVQVNERVELFYKDHPQGSIQTEIAHLEGDMVIFKAYIFRNPDDPKPCTGHAMEKAGSSFINKTSHIENCETSAVGRALAMMGYEIKKSIASREEAANAKLNQNKTTQSDALKPLEVNWPNFWKSVKQLGYTEAQVKKIAGVEDIKTLSRSKLDALYKDLKTKKTEMNFLGDEKKEVTA